MAKQRRKRRDANWNLTYHEFLPEEEKLRETLTAVGNGYFGTRGCILFERSSDTHYPGTYMAGIYNKLPSTVHGRDIYNDDFVNCPNWLLTEIKIGNGKFTSPLRQKVIDYEHNLDFHNAVMSRSITIEDRKGRRTRLETERMAGMHNAHHAGIRLTISPLNYDGKISVRSSLDGTIINDGVPRYRNLNSHHLEPIDQGGIDDGIFLHVETNQSHVQIAMCAKHRLRTGDKHVAVDRKVASEPGLVSETLTFDAKPGISYTLEKLVSISTSRDENVASAIDAARTLLSHAPTYERMFRIHRDEWRAIWNKTDIRIDGDPFAQKVVRLHLYHLLMTASPKHSIHIDAGMPARGLHGEAYRGHIFWDSIYVMPVFYQRFPDVARAALMYRFRRLDAARNYAREYGYEGAMFPWQSSNDGQEETQIIHYNPVSGEWDPDLSSRQRHVTIAIFYNVWEYYSYTGDERFLHRYGAEMLIEIARFWASITTFDKSDGRYHIEGVMGPDEFHEKYQDAPLEKGGFRDNAYTNIMVVWVLEKAMEMYDTLPREVKQDLRDKIRFNNGETDRWREITRNMSVPITKDGLICQFEGYMDLKELDWDAYREKYGNIHRMDRILKSEGDSPDLYKVSKQADALMPFYVLDLDEVIRILKQLKYPIRSNKVDFLRKNYEFYIQRTSHGSTLSKVAHATISRDMNTPEETWRWFLESLESDIYDTQGGTTTEGIHGAVMGGSINIISRVFGGVTYFEGGKIDINPSLPAHWKRLSFKLLLHGTWYSFEFTQQDAKVIIDTEGDNPLTVRVGKKATLQ